MKTNGEKVKFAVIGCGHIGKRHAEMVCRNEEAALVGLVDIKKKENLNLNHDGVPLFNSLDEFLQSGIDVDVVNIASPNGFHAEQALQILEARKHVVIEKPMALKKHDAEKVIYKALNVHKHVFTVMQNRYSPPSV